MATDDQKKTWTPSRLRQWRKWAGKTLLEMATEMPYNEGTLSEIERGLERWNQDVIERAARVLDVPPHFLISRPPPPKDTPLDPQDPEVVAWRLEQMDGNRRARIVKRFETN